MAFNRTPGTIRFRVTTGPEWKRVEQALRRVDANAANDFTHRLRAGAEELADKTRKAVMQIPTYGIKHTGLRGRVAQGVGVKITGSGVQVTASMNQQDERNIPAYLDARDGWRHPVFGNRSVWVHQSTGGSWFSEVIQDGQPELERRLTDVWEDAARFIAESGFGR
jgi:hypothetical protein